MIAKALNALTPAERNAVLDYFVALRAAALGKAADVEVTPTRVDSIVARFDREAADARDRRRKAYGL